MAKPKIDKNKLLALKERLEFGDIQRIANKLGLHRSTVAKVFKGEIRNFRVIEQAMNLINSRDRLIKALNITE